MYRFCLVPVFVFLFSIHVSAQIVGDSCSNPIVTEVCNTASDTVYAGNYDYSLTTWNVNGTNVSVCCHTIYYQVDIPDTTYKPTSLNAILWGSTYDGNSSKVYFFWFENSPCSSNPIAVDSVSLNGGIIPDTFYISYPVISTRLQYYLVMVFSSYDAEYCLSFGYTNNRPPPPFNCTSAPPPYKGKPGLDSSGCYTAMHPYYLPLKLLNDTPSIPHQLLPRSLNQNMDSLPINDQNGNGFVLSLKTDGIWQDTFPYIYKQIYIGFNQFPYYYSSSQDYTVAITVFITNTSGIGGLKGFKIEIPGSVLGSTIIPNNGDMGYYNSNGNWKILQNYGSDVTWFFNSADGRGDNSGDSSYSCKAYTFSTSAGIIGNEIFAWYLIDDYGNDSLTCPGTSCPNAGLPSVWIPLIGNGNGIEGINCENNLECEPYEMSYPCQSELYDGQCPYRYAAGTVYFSDSGCLTTTTQPTTYYTIQYQFGNYIDSICQGSYYNLQMIENSCTLCLRCVLVYVQDSTKNLEYPVDDNGKIYKENFDTLFINQDYADIDSLPFTQGYADLTVPGFYKLYYVYAGNGPPIAEYCMGTLNLLQETNCINGINTPEIENQFFISPNPSDGIFNLIYPASSQDGTIEVYNTLGEKLIDTRLKTQDSRPITIDLTSQPDGIYFVQVQTQTGSYMKKIVKVN